MKNKLYVLFALSLLAAAAWLFKTRKHVVAGSFKDFAIADTGGIDKVFLADRAGHQLLLERPVSGEWIVNKQFPARKDVMQNLLLTIQSIAVKMPVPLAAHNHVIAQLAANGVKTELYGSGKLLKTYYIGGPTQDLLGTYMIIENSDRAYVMHIPGFNGYLSTRFSPLVENWRERFIFKLPLDSLATVEINYPKSPYCSFSLNTKTGMVTNGALKNGGVLPVSLVWKYCKLFEHTPFEGWVNNRSIKQNDSLCNAQPYAVIQIKTTKGSLERLRLFSIPHDPERMYAIARDSTVLLVQHFVMDSILLQYPKIPGLRGNIYQQPK